MNREQIQQLIPHRDPFLWLDEVTERTDSRIVARKLLSPDLPVFQGHYPKFPVFPGVLQCEACFQAGAVLIAGIVPTGTNEVPVVTRLNNVQFRRMIRPGETIQLEVELTERARRLNEEAVAAGVPISLATVYNTLHQFNTDACCALRKTEPLERALQGYDAWITGRKRFQSGTRAALNFFETDGESGLLGVTALAADALAGHDEMASNLAVQGVQLEDHIATFELLTERRVFTTGLGHQAAQHPQKKTEFHARALVIENDGRAL